MVPFSPSGGRRAEETRGCGGRLPPMSKGHVFGSAEIETRGGTGEMCVMCALLEQLVHLKTARDSRHRFPKGGERTDPLPAADPTGARRCKVNVWMESASGFPSPSLALSPLPHSAPLLFPSSFPSPLALRDGSSDGARKRTRAAEERIGGATENLSAFRFPAEIAGRGEERTSHPEQRPVPASCRKRLQFFLLKFLEKSTTLTTGQHLKLGT
ncbi:uncharacterized protein LOC120300757 [Crotalus tigris]|uniref:uncharacterized protein LOC120300757 n=1 Tax=Crotalus tigris TaxID=88082 RepID=UPI00192FAB15|nr:uncharacterized protein LOC120300757 [Crotalus tigris]